jgi:hypothetical protein
MQEGEGSLHTQRIEAGGRRKASIHSGLMQEGEGSLHTQRIDAGGGRKASTHSGLMQEGGGTLHTQRLMTCMKHMISSLNLASS